MDIFVSYSSTDRDFATRLRDSLSRYFRVFFDTSSIRGGAEWEREIDREIHNSKVFLPVVTKSSNESPWVTKETLLAIELKLPIIPVLLSESLPLRLIDKQFMDFRGDFDAGFSDLLSALSSYFGLISESDEYVNNLIAKAIRSRLSGALHKSNALVEQFTGLDSSIASSGYSFWKQIESTFNRNLAKNIGKRLFVFERTRKLEHGIYEDRDSFEWVLEIHAEPGDIELIDYVVYELHPTFEDRIQKVRARKDNFRIQRVGWGTFSVRVRVTFVDYTKLDARYMLTFKEENRVALATSNPYSR